MKLGIESDVPAAACTPWDKREWLCDACHAVVENERKLEKR
jgi:hypothetical protein